MERKSNTKIESRNVIQQFNLIKQALLEHSDLTYLKLITLLTLKPKDNKGNKFYIQDLKKFEVERMISHMFIANYINFFIKSVNTPGGTRTFS